MVYKKIGNKIPSLSSLLLAGLLFTPGGCFCKNSGTPDPSADDDESRRREFDRKKLATDEELSMESHDNPYLFKAERALFDLFLPSLSVQFLLMENRLCSPISLQGFEKLSSDRLIDRIKVSVKSLNKHASILPLDLKASFEALETKRIWRHSKKRGLARLLNELFLYLNDFQDVVKNLNNTAGNPGDRQAIIRDKFIPLLKQLDEPTSQYSIFNQDFYRGDVASSVLLSGSRLARFLSDTDENGNPRGAAPVQSRDSHGTRSMLQEQASVLIRNKFHDPFKQNKSEDHAFLSQRGSSIGESISGNPTPATVSGKWLKVVDSKGSGYLPYISEIQGLTTPAAVLDMSKLKTCFTTTFKELVRAQEDVRDASGTDKVAKETVQTTKQNNLSAALPGLFNPYTYNSSDSIDTASLPTVERPLSFGTLLFTLFRGNGTLDFLSLSSKSNNGDCELEANPTNFQKWLNKSEAEFVSQLHDHVQATPELKDIFYTVDIPKIISKYFKASKYPSGTYSVTGSSAGTSTIVPDSELSKVIDAIIETFPISNADLESARLDRFDYVSFIAGLPEGSINSSLLSTEEKFCITVARMIVRHKVAIFPPSGSLAPMSITDFVSKFKEEVQDLTTKSLLVVDEEGKPCPTSSSTLVYQCIKSIDSKLVTKLKKSSISYGDVKAATDNVFDISKICDSLKETGQEVLNLFSFDFSILLMKEGPIDDNDLDLGSFELQALENGIQSINKIKEEYQASLTKLSQDKKDFLIKEEEKVLEKAGEQGYFLG